MVDQIISTTIKSTTQQQQKNINLLFINLNYDANYTCNRLKSENQTMLKLDDGWETIPESIIMDLIFSLLLLLPYYYFPLYVRRNGWDRKFSNFTWTQYFGRNNLFNLKYSSNDSMNFSIDNNNNDKLINSDSIRPIELYLKTLDDNYDNVDDLEELNRQESKTMIARIMSSAFLPKHFEPEKCPKRSENNLKKNETLKSETTDDITPTTATTTTKTTTTDLSLCSKIRKKSSIWKILRFDIWTTGITDEQIQNERGFDAYQYLLFQQYLIVLLVIMTINAICLILPINVFSNPDCEGFACTSMNNLPHGSPLCWFHANLSVLIVLFSLFLMNRFAQELHLPCQLSLDQTDVKDSFTFDENQQQKILLIRPSMDKLTSLRKQPQQQHGSIKAESVFALNQTTTTSNYGSRGGSETKNQKRLDILEQLKSNLKKSYPFARLIGIQLIMDSSHLTDLEHSYRCSWLALQSLHNDERNFNDKSKTKFQIKPCGQICCCISEPADSPEQFYRNELYDFRKKINEELQKLTQIEDKSIRGIFVEFESEQIAASVFKRLKRRSQSSSSSSSSSKLKSRSGSNQALLDDVETNFVDYIHDRCHYPAPRPDDINWRNLGVAIKRKWIRKCFCTIFLLIIFLFLSTPTYVFKLLDIYCLQHLHDQPILRPLSFLFDYLNPMLMVMLVSSMPSIVIYVLRMIPYQTISGLNHALMVNLYSFMILTVIILPSAGFLTMNAMLDNIFGMNTTLSNKVSETDTAHSPQSSSESSFHWQCLFPVDNGAFFLIYIIHATILGNLFELLRIMDACFYFLYYLLYTRSPFEYKSARMMIIQEFPISVFYSQNLLIFTMTIIFSFASPLIVPCGLAYMIGKHIVDRYNIYHVYLSPKINSQIHLTALNFVHIGLVLMLLQIFTIMLIKMEYSLVSRYILFVFVCTTLFSLIRCCCPSFLDRRSPSKRTLGQQQSAVEISRQHCEEQQQQQQQHEQQQTSVSTASSLKSLLTLQQQQQQRPNVGNSKTEICICSYTWPVFINLIRDQFFE